MLACRLPSNVSKESSGTVSDLVRKKEKIESKVKQLLEKQVEADKSDDDDDSGGSSSGGPDNLLTHWGVRSSITEILAEF